MNICGVLFNFCHFFLCVQTGAGQKVVDGILSLKKVGAVQKEFDGIFHQTIFG